MAADKTTTTVNSLRITFEDALGKSMSCSYAGVKDNLSDQTIADIVNVLTYKGPNCFKQVPTELTGVSVVRTETDKYDIETLPDAQ